MQETTTTTRQVPMAGSIEPIPATPSARWALATARAEGAIPADYDIIAAEPNTIVHWRSPVSPGGYDEVEIVADGHTFYRLDGKLHRLDGAAIVHVTNRRWFILGREYRDRATWYSAAVLTIFGLPHLGEYLEAAIHAELSPAEAAAGYRNGIPVNELHADKALLSHLT
jgi:hypothetical protein